MDWTEVQWSDAQIAVILAALAHYVSAFEGVRGLEVEVGIAQRTLEQLRLCETPGRGRHGPDH